MVASAPAVTNDGPAQDRAASADRARQTARWAIDNATVILPPVGLFIAGWRHRWIADDGMIAARTVRQILAGHGPVFNVNERVEANTSTLWTYLATLISWTTRLNVYETFMWMGLILAPLGLLFGLLGARNIQRGLVRDRNLFPLGAIVLLGIRPFWDFVTSGLEESMVFCWLGLCFWLLSRIQQPAPDTREAPGRAVHIAAFVIGLGWLVRPDMALGTVAFLPALLVITRARPRQILTEVAIAGALPAAYEVFRMGYYGLLTPNTALVKEAGAHNLTQGFTYLEDYVGAYHLWIPAVILALLVQRSLPWQRLSFEARVLLTTTAAAGIAMAAYVVVLGGDFMHARMLLPATFMLLLPFMMVPIPRIRLRAWKQLAAVSLVALGALYSAFELQDNLGSTIGPNGIADERRVWIGYTHDAHPVDPAPFLAATDHTLVALTKQALASGRPQLVYLDGGVWRTAPLNRPGAPVAVDWLILGSMGALVPLDGIAVDGHGLSYPVVAHSESIPNGRPGHAKELGPEWAVADYSGLTDTPAEAAAAKALRCGRLAEVRTATTAPLTPGRFVSNIFHSVVFNGFRFPRDAKAAEDQLCK